MMKPSLQTYQKPTKLSDYPEATCFKAGHLVSKNAGWRTQNPKVNLSKCISCGQCYLYCPDGVIYKNEKGIAIDYDFCKGCGICAKVCKKLAITMEVANDD